MSRDDISQPFVQRRLVVVETVPAVFIIKCQSDYREMLFHSFHDQGYVTSSYNPLKTVLLHRSNRT
jgi:hypothetical protein